MENIGVFISASFQFLEVKFSIYLNRSVFVMSADKHLHLYLLLCMNCMFEHDSMK